MRKIPFKHILGRFTLLWALACLFALTAQAAPTITVSASAVSILGTSQTISITCTLIDPNQTGNLRVSGTGVIPVMQASTVTPGTTATVGPIYGNDVILDGFGNLNNTYYKVQVFTVTNGIIASTPSLQNFFAFTGSGTVDLSTATPLAPSFLSGTNGSVVVPGALTVSGTFIAAVPQNVGGIQYAASYAGSSTTCGVQEAYSALPAAGGTIMLQLGSCTGTGWPVTISKPILIKGQGMGGPADAGTNATLIAGTTLVNNTTASDMFVLQIPVGGSVEGMTFKDFAIIGNRTVGGATAGNCFTLKGGTGNQQLRMINFENIQCESPKTSGWLIQDNAFMINFSHVQVENSGSHCFVEQNGPNGGVVSQIHFTNSTADLCGGNGIGLTGNADGWNISGSTVRGFDCIASTMADSNNGINVVAGATNTAIHITNCDFETNVNADINLNDGFGHYIKGSTLLGTGVGAHGILTAFPGGANFANVQIIVEGNNLSSHTTDDINLSATTHVAYIGVQATNNYTLVDSSAVAVMLKPDSNGTLQLKTFGGLAPTVAGVGSLGTTALPWAGAFMGTAATNNFKFQPAATAGARIVNLWDFGANGPGTQNYPGITILTSQYTNSTTGFTNVTGGNTLQFPVLANTTYTATCHLYYQAAATGGLNIQFTGPAAPTAIIYGLNEPVAANAVAGDSVATAFATSLGSAVTTAATNFDAIVSLSLINGANAGTVVLQAKSSAAVQLQIQAGSFCRIQ